MRNMDTKFESQQQSEENGDLPRVTSVGWIRAARAIASVTIVTVFAVFTVFTVQRFGPRQHLQPTSRRSATSPWDFAQKCADEGGTCECNGKVRFGAKGQYRFADSAGEIACSTDSFAGSPIPGAKSCHCIAWEPCAAESEVCACDGMVDFGAVDSFTGRVARDSCGQTICDSEAFGNPASGNNGSCRCLAIGAPTSSFSCEPDDAETDKVYSELYPLNATGLPDDVVRDGDGFQHKVDLLRPWPYARLTHPFGIEIVFFSPYDHFGLCQDYRPFCLVNISGVCFSWCSAPFWEWDPEEFDIEYHNGKGGWAQL